MQPSRSASRTGGRLRSLRALVCDERGISLVIALLITSALTITTAALAELIASNEHSFGRDRQETLAFNTAEAGLNYAISYLAKTGDANGSAAIHAQEPTQSGSYVAFSSTRPTSYHTFGAGTPQGTGSGEWWAEKSATKTWTIWATGLSSNSAVERELSTRVLSKTVPGTFTPASQAWSYGLFVASPGPSCFTPQGNADLDISIYVNGCIKVSGSAGIAEPTASTGNTIQVFALTTISVTGSSSIGKSSKWIKSVTALNGCTDGNGAHPAICSNSNTSHVYAYGHFGTGTAITKPSIDPDGIYAMADWHNGPDCTGSGYPTFDNNGTRNTSAPSPSLFPGTSYSCTVYQTAAHTGTPVGILNWNATTHVLTTTGTLFFDSNLSISGGGLSYTTPAQSGLGQGAVFYFDGTVTLNGNSAICGPPATPSGSSCSGKWDGTQGALVIEAINHQNDATTWTANGTAEYNIAAYVVGLYKNNGSAQVTGPVITDTALVSGTGNSSDLSNPPPNTSGGSTTATGATTWGVIPGTWQQLKPA